MSQPGPTGSSSRSCIFYKLIVPSIIHEKKLRIPEKFVSRFGEELSAVARLTAPNGRIWLVGLRKHGTKIWFYNGWQEFVEHYSIRVGYILVFKYEGHSNFKVHVFDLPTSELNYQSKPGNGCEEPSYDKHCYVFEDMEDDDFAENLSSSPLCPTPISKVSRSHDGRADQLSLGMRYNPTAAQNVLNGLKLENSDNWTGEENWHNPHGETVQFNGNGLKISADGAKVPSSNEQKQRTKKSTRKRKIDSNGQGSASLRGEEADMQFILNNRAPGNESKRIATAEERERAHNAAKAFEPANPFCRLALRPSYLYRGCIMYLPSCFAGKHLSEVSGFIKLQDPSGKQWPVRYLYKGGGGARLGRGWYDFASGNNLDEGDVCVFELINMYDVVLKVSIFRALGDAMPRVNQPSHCNVAPKSIRF